MRHIAQIGGIFALGEIAALLMVFANMPEWLSYIAGPLVWLAMIVLIFALLFIPFGRWVDDIVQREEEEARVAMEQSAEHSVKMEKAWSRIEEKLETMQQLDQTKERNTLKREKEE
jgi:hypothetical protein